jgi:hypothetical protein
MSGNTDWSERHDVDMKLATLVSVIEQGDGRSTFTLTLNIPGAVVTGRAVSHSVWAVRLKEMVANKTGDDGAAAAVDALSSVFHAGHEFPVDDLEFDRIHMVDVQYVMGGGLMPSNEGLVWRGRLKDVSGWAIGSIGSTL